MGDRLVGIDCPSWLTIEQPEQFDRRVLVEAIRGARDWHNKYICNRPIKIQPFEVVKTEREDGYTEELLEEADAGYIKLGNAGDPYRIILHSMTHAVKPDAPALLSEPLPFSHGLIRGFHGAFVLVRLHDGEDTKFTKLEEGLAERNAAGAVRGYKVNDARYFAVGQLARQQFPYDQFKRVHEWVKKNDVPSLVRARFGLTPQTPISAPHLQEFMEDYMYAWQNAIR